MFNVGHTVQQASGVTLSDELTIEFQDSEYADHHALELSFVEGTSMDVDAILEEYDPILQDWRGALQDVMLISTDSGTPGAANMNTASTTAVAGGVCRNTTGITAITDDAIVKIEAKGNGKRKRVRFNLDGGSGTVSYSYVGARFVK